MEAPCHAHAQAAAHTPTPTTPTHPRPQCRRQTRPQSARGLVPIASTQHSTLGPIVIMPNQHAFPTHRQSMFLFGGGGSKKPEEEAAPAPQERAQAQAQAPPTSPDEHARALLMMSAKQRNFISYEVRSACASTHPCTPPTPHHPYQQEHEYLKHLAELDVALSAAIPEAGVPFHRLVSSTASGPIHPPTHPPNPTQPNSNPHPQNNSHDLSYKSSGTPVRYLFELPVPVDTAGAHVAYRFASDGFDISFSVFFQVRTCSTTHPPFPPFTHPPTAPTQGVDGRMETVLPASRVDSHVEPISGDITVHRPGTVILLWDNSYR